MADLRLVEAESPKPEPIIVLDAGPLGIISNPKATPENELARALVEQWLERGAVVVLPEIADYEVRRELLRVGKITGLARLDALHETLEFWPITSGVMARAAGLWAQARRQGRPAASNLSLDADMILIAQAEEAAQVLDGAMVIATTNVRHLTAFTNVRQWQNVK
jgi:predicted nucleic acid-binding protein